MHSSEYAQLHTEYARIQHVVLYSVDVSRIHHRYVKNLAEYVASGRILVLGMPDYRPCSPSSMSLASCLRLALQLPACQREQLRAVLESTLRRTQLGEERRIAAPAVRGARAAAAAAREHLPLFSGFPLKSVNP